MLESKVTEVTAMVLDVLVVEKDEVELVAVGTEFEVFWHFIFYVKIIFWRYTLMFFFSVSI